MVDSCSRERRAPAEGGNDAPLLPMHLLARPEGLFARSTLSGRWRTRQTARRRAGVWVEWLVTLCNAWHLNVPTQDKQWRQALGPLEHQ